MRSGARLLLIGLALGVGTNVGVAWWIGWQVVRLPLLRESGIVRGDAGFANVLLSSRTWKQQYFWTPISQAQAELALGAPERRHWRRRAEPPPAWSSIWDAEEYRRAASAAGWERHRHDFAVGWPFPALGAFRRGDAATPGGAGELVFGIGGSVRRLDLGWGVVVQQRVLPLRPIWPGFVVNSLVYGGVWWLVLPVPGRIMRRVRGRVRDRRGRCVVCGYAREGLGEGVVCPECGTPAVMGRGGAEG